MPNLALPRHECDTLVEQKALRATLPEYAVLEKYSPDDWRRYRWAYYRMIEKVDAYLGRVLDALHAADPNAVVVFTSDHGECAGAHGFSEKVVFYEESVRVPFVLTWPGHITAGRSAAFVNTGTDLMPTLLDLCGLPAATGLPGRSVRPVTAGVTPADWPDHVVSENLMRAGDTPINGRMIRTAQFKYCIYDRGTSRESLFDEIKDPLEQTNLAADLAYAQPLGHCRERLRAHARRYHDTVAEACLSRLNASSDKR